jgi:hypothetical protein
MSLINDALRRAKAAQQETPTPSDAPVPHFRPVEPGTQQAARHGMGVFLPISLGLVALLALLLLWELSKRSSGTSGTPLVVAARSSTLTEAPTTATDSSPNPARPSADTPMLPKAATASPNVPSAPVTNPASAVPESSDSNRLAVATDAVVPQPPPLKLQSIVFSPTRPSALINGHVVFLGERIREYRVQAIHRDNVILVATGRTNILSLEP